MEFEKVEIIEDFMQKQIKFSHLQNQVLNRAVASNGKGDVGWHSELSSIEAPHEENLHRLKVHVKKVENYLAGCSTWTS